nr:reverse transcriptase domain-containing protein [Tanacetum cinerariifolium]
TQTKPHHTPSPEAQQSPHHDLSSSIHPTATTKTIPTETATKIPTLRDDSQGSAFPTVSGIEAAQDRENIIKTFALPHDSTSMVTSLDVDEDRRSLETWEEAGVERITKRGSNDTKELVNELTSIDAANILTSGVQAVSVPLIAEVSTVGVPIGSGLVLTISAIFTTISVVTLYSRRPREISAKDKEEELQMLINGFDKNNKVIAKHLQEYEQSEAELTIGEKIDLISELVKYQDHHAKTLKYQAQQSKPLSKKEQREFYMSVLKSHSGWKTKHFKGMTLEEIREKFIPVWKQIEDFVPMASKEERERVKRKGLKLEQGSAKKIKTSEDVSKEDLKEMMQLVPVEEASFRIAFGVKLIKQSFSHCYLETTQSNNNLVIQAVLLKNLPEKLGDPGKFLIPCDFPGKAECLALADLGASINLMPLSMCNKLSFPNLSPTCMTLELADRLISRPVGVAEDVYIKVGTFHFPVDFVVVDFDADPRVPLILRRSFLKTERALIDMFKGELTLRVGKEAITFNLDQTSRYSANYKDMTAKHIDVIDMACEDDFLLEKVDAVLALEDDPTSSEVDQSYLDSERDILLFEAFLNDDPSLPPPNQGNYLPEVRKELKICKAKPKKSSIDDPQRFIKDFSNISSPMTRLLEKDTPFHFSKEYVEAFQTLKRKITEAPILIAPDWDMPFELMCDASDFAISTVLGQRQDKHFRPIHYASKTMTEAESNYTTMEKEMLAVVYAIEKF